MITGICYSPTGTSKKTVLSATKNSGQLFDWTLPTGRGCAPHFTMKDLLYFSFPVYSGRVPKLLLAPINKLNGKGARAIIIAVYGNRHYDDALIEMTDLLSSRGFTVIGAAAIVAEHSYSEKVAPNLPTAQDLEALKAYCDKRIAAGQALLNIPGNRPYRPYQKNKTVNQPKQKIPPKTGEKCITCGQCVTHCPVSAIDTDCVTIDQTCTMCCACIKVCPVQAKQLADPKAIGAKAWLEENCVAPIRALEVF